MYTQEQGSALSSVLIVLVIVTLFIGGILGGVVLQLRFIQRDINHQHLMYEAEGELFRFFHQRTLSDVPLDTTFVTIPSSNHRIQTRVRYHGGFIQTTSRIESNRNPITIHALFGDRPDSVFNRAVVVSDSNSTLSLAGSTRIRGNITGGIQDLTTNSFKGFPFSGAFDGEFEREAPSFPNLAFSYIQEQITSFEDVFSSSSTGIASAKSLAEGAQRNAQRVMIGTDQEVSRPVSFGNTRTETVFVRGNLLVSSMLELPPYSMLVVEDSLIVDGAVSGEHVVIYAGSYLGLTGTSKVSGQLLSNGPISISGDTYLTYPSAILSNKEFSGTGESYSIRLQDKAILDGTLLYPFRTGQINPAAFRVVIDTSATVRGALYTNGQTQLQGTVLGSVLTHQFYFYESPTDYINWIKDANIDVNQRPDRFIVPMGFRVNPTYTIVDWREEYE